MPRYETDPSLSPIMLYTHLGSRAIMAPMAEKHAYRFTITFEAEDDHPAFDDPEWAADAAWGALTKEYGLRAIYGDIQEVDLEQPL